MQRLLQAFHWRQFYIQHFNIQHFQCWWWRRSSEQVSLSLPWYFLLLTCLCLKLGRTCEDAPPKEDPTLVDFKIISFDCPDCMERDWRLIINVHGKFLKLVNLISKYILSQLQAPLLTPLWWSFPGLAWLWSSLDSMSSSPYSLSQTMAALFGPFGWSQEPIPGTGFCKASPQPQSGLTRGMRSTLGQQQRIWDVSLAQSSGSRKYKQHKDRLSVRIPKNISQFSHLSSGKNSRTPHSSVCFNSKNICLVS